jgi:hypothetical protein
MIRQSHALGVTMHEIRSAALNGVKPKLVASKKPGRSGSEASTASLTAIPVKRTEPRLTNHRREERKRDILDRTTLYFRRKDYEVEVVNVSDHGVMIQSDLDACIGDRADIQFADCNRTGCTVRWIKEGRIGLEFTDGTVIVASARVRQRIYGETVAAIEIKKDRPLASREARQPLTWKGTLYWSYEAFNVKVRNISAEGAMLSAERDLAPGSKVRLNLAESGTVAGEVRWCQGGQIGVMFDERFDLKCLALSRPAAPETPHYLETDAAPQSVWAARWGKLTGSDPRRP